MTTTTPIFGFTRPSSDDYAHMLGDDMGATVDRLEALLYGMGVRVSPDATALAAEVTARGTADTALGARIDALGTAPVAPALTSTWAPYSAQVPGADFQTLRIWRQGRTGFCSGFIKVATAIGGASDVLIATIPAGLRPSQYLRVPAFGLVGGSVVRMDAYADGRLQVSLTGAQAVGTPLALSMHWSLD